MYSGALFALGGMLYMDTIEFSTVEEQIEKLKSQHLLIEDEDQAYDALSLFGYSNLIKSYRDPYVITTDSGKIYRSGVTLKIQFIITRKNMESFRLGFYSKVFTSVQSSILLTSSRLQNKTS